MAALPASALPSRVCPEQRVPALLSTERSRSCCGKNDQKCKGLFDRAPFDEAFDFGIAEGMARDVPFAQVKVQT